MSCAGLSIFHQFLAVLLVLSRHGNCQLRAAVQGLGYLLAAQNGLQSIGVAEIGQFQLVGQLLALGVVSLDLEYPVKAVQRQLQGKTCLHADGGHRSEPGQCTACPQKND